MKIYLYYSILEVKDNYIATNTKITSYFSESYYYLYIRVIGDTIGRTKPRATTYRAKTNPYKVSNNTKSKA